MFVWEREKVRLCRPLSVVEMREKATQPPQLLLRKTFLSVFQFTVNRIFSSLSLFCCSCLSSPDSTTPSFIHLQSALSELDWPVWINNLLLQTVCVPRCGYLVQIFSPIHVCERAHILYTKGVAVMHVYLWMCLVAACTEVFSCVLLLLYSPLKQPDI